MIAPRLLSGLFGALLTCYTAATAVGLTPGSIDLGLVFPLNDTYAPQDGPLPIVFRLSSQPFQPALASILQLRLSYLLLDKHNGSHRVADEDIDLGKLSSTIIDNPHFFIGYSDKLASRESFFELQCSIVSIIGFKNSSAGDGGQGIFVTAAPIVYSTYFTTQSGAKAAEVPSNASNGSSTCLPHGGWSMVFGVSDYTEGKSNTYAVMAPDSPSIGPVPCAVEVDGATAANITAGLATATATTTAASSSSTGAATSAAATSSSGVVVVAAWSLIVLGLSMVLSIW
ncbi:hypothetical protein BR93DRAFT_981354 [Coniochaeta sp. PMI_546]|nr:hypothetical protein BR93DRAFT_981354 [Coniochaeta sp. PMI_546]